MDNIVSTIQGSYLQTCHYLGIPYVLDKNTTLNTKFGIFADEDIGDYVMPKVQYMAIGNGGHKVISAADNIPRLNPILHSPKHAALYNHIPFILRPVDQDISDEERINYRLRCMITVDNLPYIAYYLKKLDLSDLIITIEYRNVADGVTVVTPFISSVGDLAPVPINLSPNQLLTPNGDYLAVSARIPFSMNENDIAECMSACRIIYGDESFAVISELALCSGIEREVIGTFNGIRNEYIDSVAVQITTFMGVLYPLQFINTGINAVIDIGSVEPLLTVV
jgi:hypothetical protein